MTVFKLDGLRHFSSELPVAVLRVDGQPSIYDLDGIRALMNQYRDTPEYSILVNIERSMLIPGDYGDIHEDDISGQESLFD